MKKVRFNVGCMAVYQGELEVFDNLTEEEILEEIHDRLDEVMVNNLEWLNDLDPEDAVTMDDIYSIEDYKEEL